MDESDERDISDKLSIKVNAVAKQIHGFNFWKSDGHLIREKRILSLPKLEPESHDLLVIVKVASGKRSVDA